MAPTIRKQFSVIFMGDTHIGSSNTNQNETKYRNLLNRVRKEDASKKTVVAVIHGGDGVHTDNQKYMQTFVKVSKQVLFKPGDRIPIFANVGNHEYNGYINTTKTKKDKVYLAKSYNKLVGDTKKLQAYRLTPDSKNIQTMLEVILLNTGARTYGYFSDPTTFQSELNAIDSYIKTEVAKFHK